MRPLIFIIIAVVSDAVVGEIVVISINIMIIIRIIILVKLVAGETTAIITIIIIIIAVVSDADVSEIIAISISAMIIITIIINIVVAVVAVAAGEIITDITISLQPGLLSLQSSPQFLSLLVLLHVSTTASSLSLLWAVQCQNELQAAVDTILCALQVLYCA